MSNIKKFMAITASILAMSSSGMGDYYDMPSHRIKVTRQLSPSEIALKAKKKRKERAKKKAKIAHKKKK